MEITREQLESAGLQYGYSKTRRHPSMKKFVAGKSNTVDLIDIEATNASLIRAIEFLKTVKAGGRQILFVGVKPEIRQLIKEVALSLNQPYVAERFIGGTLTNFPQMKKRVEKLHDLLKKKETGELSVYTKKEQLLIQRDIDRLDRDFGGVSAMNNIPSAVVIVDPRHEEMCVLEARRMHVPVIALANTDCNIDNIDYAIPGNDGTVTSVRFFLESIKQALVLGDN